MVQHLLSKQTNTPLPAVAALMLPFLPRSTPSAIVGRPNCNLVACIERLAQSGGRKSMEQ